MIYLILCALCGIGFNQGLRFGQKRGANIIAMVAVNYSVAAVVSVLVLLRWCSFRRLPAWRSV